MKLIDIVDLHVGNILLPFLVIRVHTVVSKERFTYNKIEKMSGKNISNDFFTSKFSNVSNFETETDGNP
jgi:hypothetical protein